MAQRTALVSADLPTDPMAVENHELRAVHMALVVRQSLTVLSAGWRKRGRALGFGDGIADRGSITHRVRRPKIESHLKSRCSAATP
jgi:hypothetical protein